jgi:type I restriction-modification system DNA methylase subunit
MLKNKIYTCEICKTKPDQLSHHKTHLDTQKHKDKKELFELKLSKLSSKELQKLYNTTDISIIVDENETNTYVPSDIMSSEDNKKLINSNSNDKVDDIHNKEMSDDEKQKVELSNNVSNKEALKDKIHEIHNYLRNNGAGYGMNALKVFNLLYGLKKIEEKKLLDKVNLKRPDCEFSYLLNMANENKDKELGPFIRKNVLDSISNSPIKKLLFYEIPKSMIGPTFSYLIKEIEKITVIEKTCNVLLSGKIYEYFIGRDESAISELGAYFTDRHIVDYIYKKLDPEINEDGSINSMIDMFGGSGGFTTGYINYLNDKYNNINWKNNINKVYHFDMNEDVIKSAGLEFFCLTGVLPNMEDNLKYKNSFTDEFNSKKFMNVITNPPYGGDKTSQSDTQIKRKKIKEYIKKELLTIKDELKIKTRLRQIKKIEDQEKQEKKDSDKTKVSVEMCSDRIRKYAKDNKLTGNDKESSSLILIMDMVDVNGTAIGVLKEGVFFNKTYKDIRKCLVENFNVREIISVPQDQFENTSTKTSIVIFDNTKEKTSKVKFSELTVEKYTEDKFEEINIKNDKNEWELNIILTENKDDICGISDNLISEATKDEIVKNLICSLNGKDYNKKEIVVGEGYELKKIDDICEFTKYKSQKPSDGEFNYYTCSNTIKKCSDGNINGEYILIGTRGTITEALHYYNGKFGCGDNMLIFNSNTINNKYIYNILLSTKEQIKNYINGSTIPMISLSQFKNIQIPVPKSKQKITEWVNKISKPYDKKNKNEELIMKLEEQIRNKIKDIGENEDCDEVELGSICQLKDGYDFYRDEMDDRKIFIEGENLPLLKISNEINDYVKINKKYDNFIVNKNDIIIGTKGTCGKVRKVIIDKGYFKHGVLKIMNLQLNKDYLFYYLLDVLDETLIKKMTQTSVLANMKKETLLKLKIKIPKNKKVIKDLEPLFQEIEKLQTEMKEAESQYKKLIKELSEEAIPSNKQLDIKIDNKSDNETNELSEESNENIIIETSEKKLKTIKNKIKTKSNVR